ncbi:helix-turn-helix domain-containing protein [Anaerotignum sp.]
MKRNRTHGDQIRERREELGWSLTKLSLKTGISTSAISRWERTGEVPKRYALEKIGKALGISFDLTGTKTKLYLAVTQDKYSLPLAVADSAEELAEMCGVRMETVYERISAGKHLQYPKYIMVEIEEGDDE